MEVMPASGTIAPVGFQLARASERFFGAGGHPMGKRKAAAMIAASAAIPAVLSPLFAPAIASASPSLVITNQGPATDFAGHTTTGWTGFLLTLNADAGQVIAAVDLGLNSTSTNGIFGLLLQDWHQTKS